MSKEKIKFTELFDFTRASAATYLDPLTNSVISASSNEPRLTQSGLILEKAATNLLINSSDPATQTVTVVDGFPYTLATYGTGAGYAFVSSGGSGTAPIGNPITFTASGTSVEISVSGSLEEFQLEIGSTATSFIYTEGSSETRVTDLLIRVFGDEFNDQESTFFIEFEHDYESIYGVNQILSDGTTRSLVKTSQAGEYEAYNGTITRDYPSVNPSGNTEKLAMSIKDGEWILARNGSSLAYSTSSDPMLDITSIKFFETAQGSLSKFEYWPNAKTATELEAITA